MITSKLVEGFIMLLLWTGLAITDAATFHMSRVNPETGECTIRRTKSGRKVNTWIPPEVVTRLQELALLYGPQPFLTQSRDPLQAGDVWRERLGKVFPKAGLFPFKATPHIFRHTFVRIHLSRGVPVEDVAELIGDTPEMVRKHYAEWVPERQARLIGILKESYREHSERAARVLRMPKQA